MLFRTVGVKDYQLNILHIDVCNAIDNVDVMVVVLIIAVAAVVEKNFK
jgi:hypothetical protein